MDTIEIAKDLAVDLPKVSGDQNQIEEVFLNIMSNAVQSMGSVGKLTIRVYSEKVIKNGERMVVIEFKDTGKGMDDETLKKIFDPFVTTKESGTGLGLFVSYGIIKNHGGAIEVYSKLGEGSTFSVKLPISKNGE